MCVVGGGGGIFLQNSDLIDREGGGGGKMGRGGEVEGGSVYFDSAPQPLSLIFRLLPVAGWAHSHSALQSLHADSAARGREKTPPPHLHSASRNRKETLPQQTAGQHWNGQLGQSK